MGKFLSRRTFRAGFQCLLERESLLNTLLEYPALSLENSALEGSLNPSDLPLSPRHSALEENLGWQGQQQTKSNTLLRKNVWLVAHAQQSARILCFGGHLLTVGQRRSTIFNSNTLLPLNCRPQDSALEDGVNCMANECKRLSK